MDYKVTKTEDIYSGTVISVKVDHIEYSDKTTGIREVVNHPGGAAIVAVTEGKIIFVKQYRYPLHERIYELPAGKIDNNEDPALCAIRELEEEAGYKTNKVIELGMIVSTPGFCNEKLYLYFSDDLTIGETNHQDGEHGMEISMFSLEEVEEMIRNNEIIDAKTICAIYLAKQYL